MLAAAVIIIIVIIIMIINIFITWVVCKGSHYFRNK